MGRTRVADAGEGTSVGGEICTSCQRDPNTPPPEWRGSKAKWAEKVRVVAHGLCARDYQRRRRGSQVSTTRRTGVGERVTVRLTRDEKKRVDAARRRGDESESEWGAKAMIERADRVLGGTESESAR